MIVSLIISIAGTFGDLIESMLKEEHRSEGFRIDNARTWRIS